MQLRSYLHESFLLSLNETFSERNPVFLCRFRVELLPKQNDELKKFLNNFWFPQLANEWQSWCYGAKIFSFPKKIVSFFFFKAMLIFNHF